MLFNSDGAKRQWSALLRHLYDPFSLRQLYVSNTGRKQLINVG